METIKLSFGELEYLKIELVPFIQKQKEFYLAKVKASDFLKIYTVRPAQYDLEKHSALAKSFPDDSEYYQHLLKEDRANLINKDFQREPSDERINNITKFLFNEEYALFPNTIIANCELVNDFEEYNINEDSNIVAYFELSLLYPYLSFLQKEHGRFYLIVPNNSNSILVIDGQHRLKGLDGTDDNFKENYDLLIAFILGVDRSVVAKQFYKINYEQKPVNKSLLYQLTGEFSRDTNEIAFMHNVVKLLNELYESPFYGRIKMLGITPKGLNNTEKQKLSISQAFLVDAMIRFVSIKAMNTMYPPILIKYYSNTEEHIVIVRSIARFFTAVKEIKPEWNTPEISLLSKGMGVGALLKVYNLLFPIIFF